MDRLKAILLWLRDTTERLLQGEPLRMIVQGAAVVIWLVTRILETLGVGTIEVVSLDQALLIAWAAATALTEALRRWVYSPATVMRLALEQRIAPPEA